MPLKGLVIGGNPVPFADVSPDHLPPEVVRQVTQPHNRSGIHVTDLTGCLYDAVRKKALDYYITQKSFWNLVRGQVWDTFMNTWGLEGDLYQLVLSSQVDRFIIEGKPDCIRPNYKPAVLIDTKAPGYLPVRPVPKDYYIAQLNAYKFMADPMLQEKYGNEIGEAYLALCGPSGYALAPVPLWEKKQTEDYLMDKLIKFDDLKTFGSSDPCDNEECFYCHGKEKVIWNEPS